ncbi:unnamed protein product [Bursaphelenchus okinawaensis]|uniref:Spindle assembly abnormal protein 6 N-terminal domain-containing protein n=1 Tax=Bursaphelenchus okinawaensis TaxID=465554 RepID=A0A811KVV5_9BILA|nr:unnamed protein product [Bursaphelenchus okinawaensis]CAG9113067.1 unnamed protein product [Bursaphelenchus okinawaensis]
MVVLFDQTIRVQRHEVDAGPSTSVLAQKTYNIRVETVEGQRESMLSVELSDPTDDSFLCKRRISSVDFTQMKSEQGLDKNLKFDGFGSVVIDLLNEVTSFDVILELTQCSANTDVKYCRLDFIRKVACRRVTDLALKLPIVTGSELTEHLLELVQKYKDKYQESKQLNYSLEQYKKKFEDTSEELAKLEERNQELEIENSDLRTRAEIAETQKSKISEDLDAKEEEYEFVKEDNEALQDEISALELEAEQLKKDLDESNYVASHLKDELNTARRMIKQFHEINKENTARLERRIEENNVLRRTVSEKEKELARLQKENQDLKQENEDYSVRTRQAEAALGLQDEPVKKKEEVKNDKENKNDAASKLKPLPKFKPILHSDSPKPTRLGQIARNSATLHNKKTSAKS